MKKFLTALAAIITLTMATTALNLNGTWINEDGNTRGITKLVIHNSTGKVRAWGKCHPNDCDWGRVRFNHTSRGILASWRQRGIGHKVILAEKINNRRIKVTAKLLYCDSRADKTRVYYFRKASHSAPVPYRILGLWRNVDPATRGITRLVISRHNGKVLVHAWGKCHPHDCDWGRATARREGNRWIVEWHQGFVDRRMVIKGENLRPDGRYKRLKMRIVSRYHDSRGTRTEVYRFDRR